MADTEDIIEGSDEEGESMTASEVLKKLEEAWINEKMSPTLECHQSEYIDCMLDQINQMTENLKRCKKHDFRVAIHKMEDSQDVFIAIDYLRDYHCDICSKIDIIPIDRIRYMISSYLRIRLEKIEKFAHYLLEKEKNVTEEGSSVLSPNELQYAKEYASNLESHLHTVVLQHVPENLQKFDPGKMAVKPNLDSFVFLRVKEATPNVLIEDDSGEGRDEEVDFEENSQHLVRYKPINYLLQSGAVNLI